MAFDKYKDGAWQEPEDAVKRYADGAWEECEFAKRYISGAWQEVWTNETYFLKDGVLQNGATLGTYSYQGSGNIYTAFYSTSEQLERMSALRFKLTSDMAGKKIYIKASDEVSTTNLLMAYPCNDGVTIPYAPTPTSINGLLVFDVPSDYGYDRDISATLELYYPIVNVSYYFYDVYVK